MKFLHQGPILMESRLRKREKSRDIDVCWLRHRHGCKIWQITPLREIPRKPLIFNKTFPQNHRVPDSNKISKNCHWVQSLNKDDKSKHQYEHQKLNLTYFSFLLWRVFWSQLLNQRNPTFLFERAAIAERSYKRPGHIVIHKCSTKTRVRSMGDSSHLFLYIRLHEIRVQWM